MTNDFFQDQQFVDIVFQEEDIKFKEYENCHFINCDFRSCFFTSVYFIDCIFTNCNFNDTKINYVSLRGVEFIKCDFTNVNFAMTDQVIYAFNFTDCLLDYTKFYTLKLKQIRFTGCSLVAADFMKTDLTEAIFDHCDLRRAVFIETNLSKADFTTSFNYVLDPELNKIKRAKFAQEGLSGLLAKYEIIIK